MRKLIVLAVGACRAAVTAAPVGATATANPARAPAGRLQGQGHSTVLRR